MSKNEERLNEGRGFSESIKTKTEQNKANTTERHDIYKKRPGGYKFAPLRQYCLRALLGPCKSGMGRGLRPSRPVASHVERTPAARPLFSTGRASGSTSCRAC